MSSAWINPRIVTTHHGLSHTLNDFREVANGRTARKNALPKSLLIFQFEIFLSVATVKNLKDLVRKIFGIVLRKLFMAAYGCVHYPIVGVRNSLLGFVQALDAPNIVRTVCYCNFNTTLFIYLLINDNTYVNKRKIHYTKKVKVKCILVQALRLCTSSTAHRGVEV
jgi:hypothetical protein